MSSPGHGVGRPAGLLNSVTLLQPLLGDGLARTLDEIEHSRNKALTDGDGAVALSTDRPRTAGRRDSETPGAALR